MLNVRENNPGPRDFVLVLLLGAWPFTGDLVAPLIPFAALELEVLEVLGVPFVSSMMWRWFSTRLITKSCDNASRDQKASVSSWYL